jgi:signal transduction histidine kinase/CHASE3 domain sensor protein/FixJ family two-component response regulator
VIAFRQGGPANEIADHPDKALIFTEWKVQSGFALALACLCVVGTASYLSVVRLNDAVAWVARTQEVLGSSKALLAALTDAESDERGFVITGDKFFVDLFKRDAERVQGELRRLRSFTGVAAAQRHYLDSLAPLIVERLRNISYIIDLRTDMGFDAARAEIAVGPARSLHDAILQRVDEITVAEKGVLVEREQSAKDGAKAAIAVIGGGAVFAVALVGLVLFGLRRDFAFRSRADRILRAAKEQLELRVAERTANLQRTARELESEVTARRGAQGILQSQLQRLKLLQRITHAVGERQNLRSIYAVVVGTLEEHFSVELCCLCSYSAADHQLTVLSVSAKDSLQTDELGLTEHAVVSVDDTGLSRCIGGEMVYEPHLGRSNAPLMQSLAESGQYSLVAVPLEEAGSLFGVLICVRKQVNGFSSGECEFLRQLSEHVALAAHQAQLHEALRVAYEDLRQSQATTLQQERLRALGQMASGIAHDINNAISPVTLYTESLLEDEPNLSLAARRHVEIIRRAISDVAETVTRLHEFSRQRRSTIILQPVDLNELARQVVGLTHARWSDMAQQRGVVIDMRAELDPELPVIMGIESELRDALVNLIFNAVDAMPDGGPLTVRSTFIHEPARQGRPPVRLVGLEVTDGGVGMDEDTQRRCMEPFFTTKGERGTGLGLAMVYGTMQRHGSDIQIDSALGKGTSFRFTFPAPSAHAIELARTAQAEVPVLDILVVDDDPLVSRAVRETFEKDGHRVSVADGGRAAIDAFLGARERGKPFRVVVTDLGMPHVDGHQVSQAVKTADSDAIVILLTGWGQRLLAEGGTPDNVDYVLPKPPTRNSLRTALGRCLEGRRPEPNQASRADVGAPRTAAR